MGVMIIFVGILPDYIRYFHGTLIWFAAAVSLASRAVLYPPAQPPVSVVRRARPAQASREQHQSYHHQGEQDQVVEALMLVIRHPVAV